MTVAVHTARLGYRGPDWLDVSLQGNERRLVKGEAGGHRGMGLVFAPSPELLYRYLSKVRFNRATPADWDAYREKYTAEMRALYRRPRARAVFDQVIALERVVLLCFCTDPLHCHRRVLAEIFVRLGATDAGEIVVPTKPRKDGHYCHAIGCPTPCPPEKLMCLKHWRMVPDTMQRAVWQHYRRGQCDDKSPSDAWVAAADAAINWVAETERKLRYTRGDGL